MAKSSEEVSEILKKDFVYLDLEKKLEKLQANLDKSIKAISFTICLY